jgi:phage terminase large subunit-like protein
VLSWMMGNVVARRDAKDNVFPRKARDENKIDAAIGVIAVRGLRLLARPARAYTKRECY